MAKAACQVAGAVSVIRTLGTGTHAPSMDPPPAAVRVSDETWEAAAHRFILRGRGDDAPWRGNCAICGEELGRGRILFTPAACEHMFHDVCAREWARRGSPTCPACRGPYFHAPGKLGGAGQKR